MRCSMCCSSAHNLKCSYNEAQGAHIAMAQTGNSLAYLSVSSTIRGALGAHLPHLVASQVLDLHLHAP